MSIFDEVDRKLSSKNRRNEFFARVLVYGGFFLAILFVATVITLPAQLTHHERTITVDSKDRVCSHGKGSRCKYMIYAVDGSVYENTDELVWGWRWKMDSANMQAKLHVGKTYHVRTTGFRIPFFSAFENIIYADEVK